MLSEQELNQVTEAIRNAESMTSGEIRVCVARECKGSPLDHALKTFKKTNMEKTALRNAVLIYVAPSDKKAAIIGDKGIHEAANDHFWDDTLNEMLSYFSNNQIVDGICQGVGKVGELIKARYPIMENDVNELSDDIILED